MSTELPWWRSMVGTTTMASCRQVGRLLQCYLDGEVDEVTARRFARHLELCRRCGLEHTVYSEMKAALSRRAAPIPEAALERLREFAQHLLDEPPPAAEDRQSG